jgi:hypothetical protein
VFSINGHPLDDENLGWTCLAGSTVVSSLDRDLTSVASPGRDGVAAGLQSRSRPVIVPIQVETPRANDPYLRALFDEETLVLTEEGQDGIEALVELVSISPETYGPADENVETTMMLRIPGVYWRDDAVSTSDAVAIDDADVDAVLDNFEGMTALVRDALVRVHGGASGLRVIGARGSFFTYSEALDTDEYLRFDSATGRAWLTTSDTWTGGTEVTGKIGNGAPPYKLQIGTVAGATPADRIASLTVETTARSGTPTIEVRGRRAHAR